jgi:hypothetical protein
VAQGPVEKAIRTAIHPGQTLETPSQSKPFTVETIDSNGVVLLLGEGQWQTRLTWECLEGIVPYLREHGGKVDIGSQHTVKGRPGTLDAYLKGCIKRTTAGWVAVVLERAGVVQVIRSRPPGVLLLSPKRPISPPPKT